MLPVKIGAVLGAAIPAGFGASVLVSIWSHPKLPNTGECGLQIIGAWIMILCGTPVGVGIGAAAGVIWSLVYETFRSSDR